MRKRKRKKKYELNALDFFVMDAREQGLTYAQAQVRETCEMLRRQEIKRKLQVEGGNQGV
ncbi:hypothetical protein D5278_13765 [bacterium 1XD21-13]|nr:hypothetical protein [bacterium 1XD21-13]